jgi:hypothetical protein
MMRDTTGSGSACFGLSPFEHAAHSATTIEVAPMNKVLEGAYLDEARLAGSDIKNRDELLERLRKAGPLRAG